MAYLEVFPEQGRLKRWHWRRKGGNHEIMVASQGYTRRASAKRAATQAFPSDGEPRILG